MANEPPQDTKYSKQCVQWNYVDYNDSNAP